MVVSDRQLQRWQREVWLWVWLAVVGMLGSLCLFVGAVAFFVDMARAGLRSPVETGHALGSAVKVVGCWCGSKLALSWWANSCIRQLDRIHLEMRAVIGE